MKQRVRSFWISAGIVLVAAAAVHLESRGIFTEGGGGAM